LVRYISMGEYTAENPIIAIQIFPILDFHIRDEEVGEIFVELDYYSLFRIRVTRKHPCWTITRCRYGLTLRISSQGIPSLDFGFQFNAQTVH
jgi:hypothetical protein